MNPLRLLNLIELETRWGYRSFELYQGSVVAFPQPVDLLAVSALVHDLNVLAADPSQYRHVQHTLIGALFAHAGLDVARLGRQPQFDLRAALGCWVSSPTPSATFRRVVCVEYIGLRRTAEEALDNLFAAVALLEARSVAVQTLVLPLLGTGGMRLEAEPVMRAVLAAAQAHLPRLQKLERIVFIELDPRKAEALDQAMNAVLGRVRVVLPRGELIKGVRQDILQRIEAAAALSPEGAAALLGDLRRVVSREDSRSFEIGIMGRRLAEAVVHDLVGTKKGRPLMNAIEDLAGCGIADWIRSYLHTLRTFGNEAAHEKGAGNRRPPVVGEADVALCLFCIQRVLDFWLEVKKQG
jgi:hypothetical protein